ncbi:hypothetical protein DPSP01_001581 [Paraphaeosphaeria sporulosa]|uniref:Mid2 domain-containing protein n=1 Tax=Paraphaeosphaeria sporulosa TaxID=1460663 RepID=A0A177CIN2_9PLEO|nr:uncharacterized protein CC84DRAFT_1215744 [Paraphaeosphaeria sporulosa]OAG06709.1 hypothetical protein CC84DRAFT_1215744 [Paraphaeosphaeria sporulosa]
MPAITQPAMQSLQSIKRALNDPETANQLLSLIARKTSKVGKKKSKKIKGGAIAGIVIGVIVVIIIAVIILLLLRRRAKKRQITNGPQMGSAPAARV